MNFAVNWLGSDYNIVKALHVLATFFWIAGLFILPRYLVFQAETNVGTAEDRQWITRVARLRRIILTPSMVLVWLLGLSVAFSYGMAGNGWIHAKITLAILLSGYQGWMSAVSRRMARGERPLTARKLRLWNEAPALFTILFVFLAILKPF